MEDERGSEETSTPSKSTRKRTRSRGASEGHFVINVADERREISYASPFVTEKEPTVTGNSCSNCEFNMPMFSNAQYCYSLLEAMPLPGPIWSTTAPSVLAESPTAAAPIEASVGFQWGENQASSYTWWLGFLESLDDNMTTEELNCPFVENIGMENSKVLSHESAFVDAIDHKFCPDDWLIIPSVEKDFEDMVMP